MDWYVFDQIFFSQRYPIENWSHTPPSFFSEHPYFPTPRKRQDHVHVKWKLKIKRSLIEFVNNTLEEKPKL